MKFHGSAAPRHAFSLILIIAAFLLFSGPSLSQSAGAPITLTDALGRSVSFPRPPERIVLTGKGVIQIADAVYLFPEASARIAAIGRTAQGKLDFIPALDPDYGRKMALENNAGPEQIAAARPDAVFLKSSVAGTMGKPIEALGIPVVYFDFETPEQYDRDLMNLGRIFGNRDRAGLLVSAFHSRMERIAKALEGLTEEAKPRVLLMYYNDQGGAAALNVPPLGWMQTLLVRMAGGRPAWKDAQIGQGWTKVSIEQIAVWDPDQIYIISYIADPVEVVKKLSGDAQWKGLRAVKQGRLLPFPADYYSWDQPDPRWILGLTWLARTINPERFAGMDMRREIESFYMDFYGMDAAAFGGIVLPHVRGALP
jgi:iron complex transport system substrate-binding protein